MTILPRILQVLFNILEQYIPSNKYFIILDKMIPGIGSTILNASIQTVYNIVMYFIYTGKYPFFEQYRVNNVLSFINLRINGHGNKIMING